MLTDHKNKTLRGYGAAGLLAQDEKLQGIFEQHSYQSLYAGLQRNNTETEDIQHGFKLILVNGMIPIGHVK